MHQVLFDLVHHRYLDWNMQDSTAYERLGFHLACCLSSQFPKTGFDVLLWQVATLFLLANFKAPPADKFEPSTHTCTSIRSLVLEVYAYYCQALETFGEHIIPTVEHSRLFCSRAWPK